jgi:hypothetical protein
VAQPATNVVRNITVRNAATFDLMIISIEGLVPNNFIIKKVIPHCGIVKVSKFLQTMMTAGK